jgi:hypothetical protein
MRVTQDEVLDEHKVALQPDGRARVLKMCAGDPAVPDRAGAEALVQPGQSVFRSGERMDEPIRPAPV